MPAALAFLFGAILGAVGFRVRGGWFGDLYEWGGQSARLFWAACMTTVMIVTGWPWDLPSGWHVIVMAVFLVAAWFAGAASFGTFKSNDAGFVEGKKLTDGLLGSLRGALYAVFPMLVLSTFWCVYDDPQRSWWALALPLSGLMAGPLIALAWRVRRDNRPTELAEFLVGGALGLGAVVAVAFA